MIRLVVKGNPITKKNSMQIVKMGARYGIIPSKQYKAYEKEFVDQISKLTAYGLNINKSVNIKCIYYMKTHRKVDLTNLLSATMDCLVKAKVIEDDNCNIATGNDGSRVYYDKVNPRVEIEIEEMPE